jgi:hypothetical protein
MIYKDTELWQQAQADIPQEYTDQAERLRAELGRSRSKAEVLTGRIAAHFPSLTLHDLSHLDGLWVVGSLLAGPGCRLNPLEAFVFGEAVLLHDAALCFEAYEGGRAGVRDTVAWKDAFALEERRLPGTPLAALQDVADFLAVRNLHAQQASKLVERSWADPTTKDPIYLIEDTHLRRHLGELIGKIAASHHWSIEDVRAGLPHQFNAPAELPGAWSIQPRKLACLLRCADALHIDNRRAPDFFHALLRRSGVSFHHWQAQNQIGNVSLDCADSTGRTVLLTTTRPFPEADASCWWVIFDAAGVAQRELESSNALLESDCSSTMRAKRIRGIESPEAFAQFVRASGWNPCAAQIHISNVEQLIGSLGGRQLYGNDVDPLFIGVRELVQNARDALKARQHYEPGFAGEIKVRVSNSDPVQVDVSDNGIGMSRRVLTGPLLDFGTSFWASSLVQSELPGLSSSSFAPIGKFGIGFYAVFMASERVSISSRRWNEGLKDTHTLEFTGGLALRPLLKAGAMPRVGTDTSTFVSMTLKPGIVAADRQVLIHPGMSHLADFKVPLAQYLAVAVAGLDVDVEIEVEGYGAIQHRSQPLPQDQRFDWLKRIAFADYREKEALALMALAGADRLRPIHFGGRCIGLAAISTLPQQQTALLSVATVGGLAVSVQGGRSNFHIGFIDHPARSARRDNADNSEYAGALKAWAEEQAALLAGPSLNPLQRFAAAYGLAQFGVDPSTVACLSVWTAPGQLECLTIPQLVERMRQLPLLFCATSKHDHIDSYAELGGMPGVMVFQPISNGTFNSLKMDGAVPAERFSAIGCIYAEMIKAGLKPSWERRPTPARSMLGPTTGVVLKVVGLS